jgi:allantoinase
MNALDLLVHGGTLVTEEAAFPANVGVREGKIVAILAPDERPSAEEVIDARRLHVLPGVVDAHVHFNEPGRTHWEGYETGTMAAALGGTTTVLDMPLNSSPPTLDGGALEQKRQAVRGWAYVDYGHWGGVVTDNLAELEGLERGGVVGYKAFMCGSGIDEYQRVMGRSWLDRGTDDC